MTPDGTQVIAGCDDHTIRVWDMRTGAELLKLNGHGGAVWGVAVTPDAARIVSGSADSTARIWSFKSGAERAIFPSTAGEVNAVTAMPDGARVVAGFDDRLAQIMDVATGAVLASRFRTADWNGLKPSPTITAPAMATGVPKPDVPSMIAPKEKAISTHWSRRSNEM